jgi:hypothetical protein
MSYLSKMLPEISEIEERGNAGAALRSGGTKKQSDPGYQYVYPGNRCTETIIKGLSSEI